MSPSGPRWRGRQVPLAILGGAGGAIAVGVMTYTPATFHRNVYSKLEQCAEDYSPTQCSAPTGGTGLVRGPVYRMKDGKPSPCNASDPGPGRNSSLGHPVSISVEKVDRGGFGTQCRRYSSGG